jgi:hypothetical protein
MACNKDSQFISQTEYTLSPAEPLWKRAPTCDSNGQLLSDFMMLIPRLSQQPDSIKKQKIAALETVFHHYGKAIVFVDLNLKLNVLWVTVRPIPGICLELPAAIKHYVPEALLVNQQRE